MRLDQYLVKNGLATGRDRAKEMILSGRVTVDGRVCKKPSTDIDGGTVAAEGDGFVGRGAKKLEKATVDTIESGYMTGDLAAIWKGSVKPVKLNSEEFILAITKTLDKSL